MVSVIVPVYNEEESLKALYDELSAVMQRWGRPYEIVFVNDGSVDRTGEILDEIAQSSPHVIGIQFRRNFGQTAALSAGIDHSHGEIIVPMDGDLQNDPADIPILVGRLADGFDAVSGWRRKRHDAVVRSFLSRCANRLISAISGVRLHDYGCSLKAYRREVIEGVRLYGEMHRFVPIYAAIQGGRVTEIEVNHRPRRFGVSKYGMGRIFKVILDLWLVKFLMSYSSKPIYVFGGFGLFCLGLSVLSAALAFFFKFTSVPGWQKDFVETPLPTVTALSIMVGMLALLQGLLAEVLMRTYFESQDKRTYIIKRISRASQSQEEVSSKQ
jgi:glycosyltransferase involved in cell wall biosynthesis